MPTLIEEGNALMELTDQRRTSNPTTRQTRVADRAAKAPKIEIKKLPVDKNTAPLFAT